MVPKWEFGLDYALNKDEELRKSIKKDDFRLT